jgi:hypothetical protein
MVSPLALLGAVPLVAAPLALRDRVLEEVELVAHSSSGGPPKPPRPSRVPMVAAATALLVAIGMATVWDLGADEPGSAVAQDQLPITPSSIRPTPPSEPPPSTTTTPPPTTTTTTTPPPTTTTTTTTTRNRVAEPPPLPPPPEEPPEEPPAERTPPRIGNLRAAPLEIYIVGCEQFPQVKTITATITDDTGVTAADVRWSLDEGKQAGTVPMSFQSGRWQADLKPFTDPGLVTWTIAAADAAENIGTAPGTSFPVSNCTIR